MSKLNLSRLKEILFVFDKKRFREYINWESEVYWADEFKIDKLILLLELSAKDHLEFKRMLKDKFEL